MNNKNKSVISEYIHQCEKQELLTDAMIDMIVNGMYLAAEHHEEVAAEMRAKEKEKQDALERIQKVDKKTT